MNNFTKFKQELQKHFNEMVSDAEKLFEVDVFKQFSGGNKRNLQTEKRA